MKRLIKKASIILTHATTFEAFIDICKNKTINPFNEVKNDLHHSNSLDQDSVYLSRYSGWEFASEMMSDDKYSSAVMLKINANEDNLLPAYDNIFEFEVFDIGIDGDEEYVIHSGEKIYKKDLTWKDTLDIADECRHKGQISIDDIKYVKFFSTNTDLNLPNDEVSIGEAEEIIKSFL